jgi:phosphate-selective porin OprO/OprP
MIAKHLPLAALILTASLNMAVAGTPVTTTPSRTTEPSEFDKIWGLATLYKDKNNPWLEEVSFFGRAHTNWAAVDSDKGNWSDWEQRRLRAGLKVKFLQEFELKTEVRFIPQGGSAYAGLTEASLTWNADPAFRLTVGKQLPRYTLEGALSSNELLTVERSLLANTFWVGEENFSTGITATGDIGHWQYYVAFLSGESDKAFGDLDAGFYSVTSLGYDFATELGADKALLRADYVYNDGDGGNTTTKPFENTVGLGFDFKQGRFGVQSNVLRASGLGKQPDAWGFVLMPTYSITPKLELVARYTFLDGEGAGAIKPQRRYENEVPGITGTKGDGYQAGYLGLNYYVYGHKLKFQSGIEYSRMSDSSGKGGDYSAWNYLAGFRLSF